MAAKRGLLSDKEKHRMAHRLFAYEYRRSKLLDDLFPARQAEWVHSSKRLRNRTNQKLSIGNFSFFSDPIGTIRQMRTLTVAEAKCLSASVNFTDKTCLDIGAWLVLSAMRSDMAPVFTGGTMPNELSRVLSALQLDVALGMNVNPVWPNQQDIWAFPVHRRRPAGTSTSENLHLEPQSKEKAGDALCLAINRWLTLVANQELSRSGRRHVMGVVGETLDNAERHADHINHPDDSDWMLSGMMVRRKTDGVEKFDCQLAFLSIGQSIAQTIATCPPKLARKMEQYIRTHAKGFPNRLAAIPHLRTIFALQPGVTRDELAYEEQSGGTGFTDIIALFAELAGIESGDNPAQLAIVSGTTCLHIGYPHCTSGALGFGKLSPVWLNASNSPEDPPEHKCVISLEHPLAGTLVTMKFTLDREYLERTANGNS